ncbi:MAG: hypothetical protein M3O15_02860 [Acidobacteriota bacterium]|nr:hypothetical protein [Acidobacteriota bacterium]
MSCGTQPMDATAYTYYSNPFLALARNDPVTGAPPDCNNNLSGVWDGNHPQASNPLRPTTSYRYDAGNRLIQMSQPVNGSASVSAITTYNYDLEDHLQSVRDSEGNLTSYVTSDRDLLTSQVSPVTGTTTYFYNGHGALVQQNDGRGVVARVPKADIDPEGKFGDLELGACYVAGIGPQGYTLQYHIQLSAVWDRQPRKNAGVALRYMPDVVATASMAQLLSSEGYGCSSAPCSASSTTANPAGLPGD